MKYSFPVKLAIFTSLFPPLGFGPISKLVLSVLLFNRLSNFKAAILLLVAILVMFAGLHNAIYKNADLVQVIYDTVIIVLITYLFASKKVMDRPTSNAESIFLIAIIAMIAGAIFDFGNVGFTEDYGSRRLYLGMGPASLAILAGILCLISLHFRVKLWLSIAFPIALALLFLSQGRGPLVALSCVLILRYAKFRDLHKILIFGGLATGIYLVGGFDAVLMRSNISAGSDLSGINMSGRALVWQEAISRLPNLEIARNGIGQLGKFLTEVSSSVGYNEDQMHSELLRLYFLCGLVGSLGYIFLLASYALALTKKPQLFNSCVTYLLIVGLVDNTLIYSHFWIVTIMLGMEKRQT